MTDKELKKKIVEVVNQWHMFQDRDMNGHTIWLTNDSEKLADALIEAGIGDVETTKKIGAHATAMAVLQAAKAEHRAEVAEMALKDCIDYYSYSGLCPVLNCNYNKACWRKECTPDIEKCFMIQAEKELAEGKEENNAKNQRE